MNRLINTIFGVGLLALSGNAAAIMIDEQVYGVSNYTLPEIDQAIEAFREDVSSKREKKLLKKALKLDRKVAKLGNKLDLAAATGEGKRLDKKSKKLTKKERKLLAILADYLPEYGGPVTGSNLLLDDIVLSEQDTILPIPEDVFDPVTGRSGGNNPPGAGTGTGYSAEAAAVPEPAIPALLCLGLVAMLLPRLGQRSH